MSEKRFKAGILGLNDKGQALLQAAEKSGLYQIVAVAGRDPEILAQTARKYNCPAFEDYRQLVVRNQLDILFVAGSMHFCDEQVRAAMKKGCDVLRVVPPGLDFEQAVQLVLTAHKEKVRYIVANVWRFAPSFEALGRYLTRQNKDSFHLITAVCNQPQGLDDPRDRWLTDPKLAGGGVVMYNCYELIDQILLHFDIPQQVYSLNTNRAPDRQQRLSITEDTAVLTMRFSDKLIGNLVCSRTFGPVQTELRIHSNDGFVSVTRDSFTVHDNQGNITEQNNYSFEEDALLVRLLENVAMNACDADRHKLFVGRGDDLKTMAVIQAAYLSARTAAPEEPTKLLDLAGSDFTNIIG